MTGPEKAPEWRIRELVRKPDTSVGRIRMGKSTDLAHTPPVKIDRWRLTAPSAPPACWNVRRLPPFWVGLLSVLDPTGRFLARYFREERPRRKP